MKLIVLLMIACSVLPAMEAIKCYSCNSVLQNCDNVKDGDKFVVTCPASMPMCYVTRGKTGDLTVTEHGCIFEHKAGCEKAETGKMKGEICWCNEDKCNGSNNVATSSIVSVLALISVIVYSNCY
ncbi:uncharacterized protein LOC119075430 [Bradysia coprophila]|uniref:uncharacterized protein LOC119075430 n=1 Tax=Bradysia coprophila TaxID=38358 RepID=UPI00187D91F1|nr:uncharacterized protein LOC119075430 [Bradysia coprophila]